MSFLHQQKWPKSSSIAHTLFITGKFTGGWEAVGVALASGKRLRLGTDEPRRLTQVLLAATRERA